MTNSPIFAVQYLESLYSDTTSTNVRYRLRCAFERLPISLVLLGWELPFSIEEAVAEETVRHNAKLFRWQPLLTGDGQTIIPSEWVTVGNSGNPIPGHGGLPEFSFICPNQNAVTDFLSERVENVAAQGLFQGLFLDRIRFPSPCTDPLRDLACFCHYCANLAADIGLDLEAIRNYTKSLPAEAIIRNLFRLSSEIGSPLDIFMNFREASITSAVQKVAKLAHGLGLSIGLDCFSPILTSMVGQNLTALDRVADWVKIMVYPRVFGPAGLPFELLNLVNWLILNGYGENTAVDILAEASGLPIPTNKTSLLSGGLESRIITQEVRRGKELGVTTLLAGIAMVNMKKVHTISQEQIKSDLIACRNADGLVISWDLWLTPLSYLDKISNYWC
jgi:hypothetical protein